MINKRILILFVIFATLLTISSVSATDNLTDDSGFSESNLQSANDMETVTSGDATFTTLYDDIKKTGDGGTLVLNKDYKFNSSLDGNVKNKGVIEKSITIDGQGHSIDGDNLAEIFTITAKDVVLKDIVFKNGYSKGEGSIKIANTDCTISNCSFENFYGNGVFGAGIYIAASDCTIVNSSFDEMRSVNQGSAVYLTTNNGTVYNCSFRNCYSENGGTVYMGCENDNIISDCSFTYCSSKRGAGGLFTIYFGDDNFVSGCSFINCSTEGNGGGAVDIIVLGQDNGVLNCEFINCSSQNDAGAFYIRGADFEYDFAIFNCTFENNSAVNNGGAIDIDLECVYIVDCIFSNNSAKYGGAINWIRDYGFLANSTLTDNHAERGGAIFSLSFDTVSFNCSFADNTASDAGGAICIGMDYFILDTCNFTSNSAKAGGAIDIMANIDENLIFDCNFISNSATGTGGAIQIESKSQYSEIAFCSFVSNSASTAGAIYCVGDNNNINNCSFVDNSYSRGVIFCTGNNLTISDSILLCSQKFVYSTGSVVADYNWWGNTISNYQVNEKFSGKVTVNNWFVLDIVNNTQLIIDDNNELLFDLTNLYDGESISHYDNCQLADFTLILSSTFGVIDDTVNLVNGSGIANFSPLKANSVVEASASSSFSFSKLFNSIYASKISVKSTNITFVDREVLTIDLKAGESGTVYLYVNDQLNKTFYNKNTGVFDYDLGYLSLGNYTVKVTFSGSGSCLPSENTTFFTVSKIIPVVTFENLTNTTMGDPIEFYVYCNSDGNVSVTINGKPYDIVDGKVSIPEGLSYGKYVVNVIVSETEDYKACEDSSTFYVSTNTYIKIISLNNFDVGGLLLDANGKGIPDAVIYYTIDNGDVLNVTTDDEGLFIIKAPGDCFINITHEGDGMTNPSSNTFTIKNLKPVRQATIIEVENQFTRYANDYNAGERGSMFYFTLRDGDGNIMTNKSAKIGINGVIYNVVTDSNGQAGLQINLAKSTAYTYAIAYLGDDEYNASFAVSKLNLVKKPITITPKKTSYTFTASAKNKYVEATLTTIKNPYDGKMYLSQGKKVTLTINGKTYTATAGKNGAIKFNIGSTTKKGTYKVTINYAGDATYESSTSKQITIKIS